MPVMDEFREEREALKHGTWKQKISYFFEYYKWHVVAAAAAIFFVVSIGYEILTHKDTAFYAAMINAIEMSDVEEYTQNFAAYAGIDPEKYDVVLDTTMHIDLDNMDQVTIASTEKLMANITAKNVDVFITDAVIMEQHANGETFLDLREFLTEEQYDRYKSRFYYVDQAIVDARQAHYKNFDTTFEVSYPDPRNPDAMQEPVPVGIYLNDTSNIKEYYYYAGEDIIAGVVCNTTRKDAASRFLDYILE